MTLAIHHGIIAATDNGPIVFPVGLSTSFDGIDEVVRCGTDPDVQFDRLDPFSLAAWIKHGTDSDWGAIIANAVANPNALGWHFFVSTANEIGLNIANSNVNGLLVRSTELILAAEGWTHVTATYDGSSAAAGITLYKNGRDAGLSITLDTLSASSISIGQIHIGGRDPSWGSQIPFDGQLDEIAIWNRAITPREVAELYSCGQSSDLSRLSSFSDAIHWWRMGEGDTIS